MFLGRHMDKLLAVHDSMRDLLTQCLAAKLPDSGARKRVLELYRFCCDYFRFTIQQVNLIKDGKLRAPETDPTQEGVLRLRFPVIRYDVDLRQWEFERNFPMKEAVKESASSFVMFFGQAINLLGETAAEWYSQFEGPKSFATALAEFREPDSLDRKEVEALKGLVRDGVAKGILMVEPRTGS